MSGKSVHLIGIGGVGMAGLAVLLKARGYAVSGCDLKSTARTRWLESLGIGVSIGHSPDHLNAVDEVVVTPAVAKDNPELLACRVPVRFRGEVLAELVGASEGIAVCGSHGKTTTSTWIARLLLALGEDVSWCIGGETGSFPVAGIGRAISASSENGEAVPVVCENGEAVSVSCENGEAVSRPLVRKELRGPLVVEADESDGTLALYKAKTLVVTNCEYDHADHFKTPADYVACFETAKSNADDVIESEGLGSLVGLECLECFEGLAPHNRMNARAAVEVALRRGHKLEDIAKVLPSVVAELPDRRFQVVWPPSSQASQAFRTSLTVVTDYAHHPTEMKNAIAMARRICRGTLRVLYQPHRYSRTKALLGQFPAAFEGADEVVLCPTYAAFEEPLEGGDIADLYRACRESFSAPAQERKSARLFLGRSCEEAWEHARNSMSPGDLTLLLGAGDIIGLVPQVLADFSSSPCPTRPIGLARPSCPGPASPRRVWIGAGSNTWKPDLNLSVEYVRTTGPADAPGASLGIPWMAGVPGTIGGWVKMNAGAFGHSVSELVDEVKVDGRWLPAAACGFAYRHSDIEGEIQDVRWKIRKVDSLTSGQETASPLKGEGLTSGQETASPLTAADYLARRPKFPAGTYGSFFKNPPGDRAGRLLEEAGAKELRVGGAYVWQEHANVIVRGEGATSSDVLALARLMRNRVWFRFGVALEPEVQGIVF